ncbi:MAG: hypothetical protein A2X13_03430 [Bacteroidetes bacterium GWC2_33_15]|nr:MAG: hypothetical protein A2X10_13045 [Bacteroidetes bacterium GWA2_33_15]OFX51662.1 MAG: hypothetical protein A2X13_03430 [Bacteroidetes bacterium GWC2_33_15]OFX66276.1 MAG: hypothetical protein A2X15_14515 [Bacteroidetes bacterium GWB2_32_14]OFX66962.1 MAG: hypothetical protein A2X14_00590 [Bacteroidetes bacterium GWD2_33_33]HAN17658.1 hypothetical protein [Bacteroidales bacterium]
MNIKNNAIQDIQASFIEFANLILKQLELLEKQMNCNENLNCIETLEQIKKNEERIDQFEIEISDKFIHAIVLYHPVASELRKIIAIYRMSINLERIGDLVVNITNSVRKMKDSEIYSGMSDVVFNMLMQSIHMVEKSLLSFINKDKEYAIWTIQNDSVVDKMNHKLLTKAIDKNEISDEIKQMLLSFTNLRSIISNIERIADHATNIAEASIYSLDGTDIRHTKLKNDDVDKKDTIN